MFVKLSYCDVLNWNIAASVLNNPLQLQTSLNNPRRSPASGHQPYWYDQWTPNIYTKYRVYGIKYHLTVMNKALNESWYVGVRPQLAATAETNIQTLMERKDAKVRMGSSVNSGNNRIILKGFIGTAKTLGIPRSEVKTEEWFAADYNADPIKMAYLYFYASHNFATSTISFDVTLKCTYYAELFGKATPVAS